MHTVCYRVCIRVVINFNIEKTNNWDRHHVVPSRYGNVNRSLAREYALRGFMKRVIFVQLRNCFALPHILQPMVLLIMLSKILINTSQALSQGENTKVYRLMLFSKLNHFIRFSYELFVNKQSYLWLNQNMFSFFNLTVWTLLIIIGYYFVCVWV